MNKLFFYLILSLCIFSSGSAFASDAIAGKWKVQTKLVAAQDAVNQNYNVGDVRRENWKVKIKKKQGTLTTPSGTISGTKIGKAWVFNQNFDTGYGVIINMHIVAKAKSSELMKGTIEVRYLSAQFGYELGIDAWSFTGFRKL